MKNIAGFYKLDNDALTCAPNAVYAPTFELVKDEKDNYTYPVEGWTWFDTLNDACAAYGLDLAKYIDLPAQPGVRPGRGFR